MYSMMLRVMLYSIFRGRATAQGALTICLVTDASCARHLQKQTACKHFSAYCSSETASQNPFPEFGYFLAIPAITVVAEPRFGFRAFASRQP